MRSSTVPARVCRLPPSYTINWDVTKKSKFLKAQIASSCVRRMILGDVLK
jgi:hypothetical protein